MPGRRQDDAIYALMRRGVLPGSNDRFRPATTGSTLECVLCGATGYGVLQPAPEQPHTGRWQLAHLLPHAYACTCGRAFLSAAAWALHLYHERHDPPRVTAPVPDAGGERECARCGDEVLTLSTDDLCDGCVAEDATTTACPNCDERVPRDEMRHWPLLAEPVSMCASCEHNARRSGWEPGVTE